MKIIILTLALLMAMPACQLTPEQVKLSDSIGRPIAVLSVKKYIEKKPSNRIKVISFIFDIEKYSKESLELKDFIDMSKSAKLGSDWAIVMDSIYKSYKDRITNADKKSIEAVKSYIIDILKDAVLLVEVQK